MKLEMFSEPAQAGLRVWAEQNNLLFPDHAGAPEFWAWMYFELRESEDRPEWFPRGKWATLQFLEAKLSEAARTVVLSRGCAENVSAT